MIPGKALSLVPHLSGYISPDGIPVGALQDYTLGGIGLSDSSQGLQVQTWTAYILGTGINTSVWVSAPNTAAVQLFVTPGIIWVRLAFDQNMHPVIAYVSQNGTNLYWWDPTVPGQVFTPLDPAITNPCVTMDDKRPMETTLGNNDVILAYVRINNLYYRQERDRYGVEYTLANGLNNQIISPFLNKVGMNTKYRLQFDIYGNLYP